ncbi:MAG: Sua5/YciO/YrdC/YwlC family protein [Candidatus Kaiserbacteria bacterium]|nr:Sua5/YciO/YrdC/YwlC family protein [Candidatus Kaiserbacteria bacterium]
MTTYPLDEKYIPEWVSLLQQDLLCIYPTDSIYGIGGVAHEHTAAAIKGVKGRGAGKSFSVIAPSVQWITTHCTVPPSFDFSYRQPTTYLFRKKEAGSFLYLSETDRLGVRLLPPEHVIQKLTATVQQPLISTSANHSGEPVGSTIEEIPPSLRESVAFIIDAGTALTTPSRLLDADTGKEILRS